MSAFAAAFSAPAKKAALVSFITAGFPRADSTPRMMESLAAAGADVLEIGMPFSDPSADGPAIQRANETALQNGMTLAKTLEAVAAFRAAGNDTPVALMGYANSALNWRGGVAGFGAAAQAAGVNGLIIVDPADDERAQWRDALNASGIEMINLIAPTTSAARLGRLAAESQGFVYAVSLKGVTGAKHMDAEAAGELINAARRAAKTPVAAGFGVRTPAQARALGELADGVVVGSRIVEAAETAAQNGEDGIAAAAAVVAELAAALKSSPAEGAA